MSYDEWLALPTQPKAEWVDGEVVAEMNAPSYSHQDASFRLMVVLRPALSGLFVVQEVGVKLPNNRVRIPDISVLDRVPDEAHVTTPPIAVVEILSHSTRSEDTVRKSAEYAAAGIGQYWILDPELYALDVYENSDGGWNPILHLDDHVRDGQVTVAGHPVQLKLDELLVTRS